MVVEERHPTWIAPHLGSLWGNRGKMIGGFGCIINDLAHMNEKERVGHLLWYILTEREMGEMEGEGAKVRGRESE